MPLARRLLMIKRVTGRIRDDAGFGLVELMIALTTLTVAIGALLALFASSMIALNHSGKEGTAITLADRQLESYRAMPFSCIPNSTLADPNPGGCGTYNGFPNPYAASQTTTTAESPDNRIYTVTTAVTSVGQLDSDQGHRCSRERRARARAGDELLLERGYGDNLI